MLSTISTFLIVNISNIYSNVTFAQPSFWFSSRNQASFTTLIIYGGFVLFLLVLALSAFYLKRKSKDNPFKRKFFQKEVWYLFVFSLLAIVLALFHLQGLKTLSARALWLVYFFGLFFFVYLSFLDYSRKLPEKTQRFEAEQIKKRYLRPFKRKR